MCTQALVLVAVIGAVWTKDLTGLPDNVLWKAPRRENSLGPLDAITDSYKKHLPRGTNENKSILDAVRMPGTEWCGKGWRTDTFYKLGGYSQADRCCRQHDLGCSNSIQPGQTKYGLTNYRFHTVMHCTCDDRFRSCLKMTHSGSGNMVGNLFFNMAKIPCFVSHKAEVCTARNWWGSCLKTEVVEKASWRQPIAY